MTQMQKANAQMKTVKWNTLLKVWKDQWSPLQQVGLGRLLLGSRGGLKKIIFLHFLETKITWLIFLLVCELTGLIAIFRLLDVHGGIAYCLLKNISLRMVL